MNEFGAPEWNEVPDRAISQAYLPFSPTSNPREAIFMRTLESILNADRRFDIEDLKQATLELDQFSGDSALAQETWEAFASAYITETGDSTRGDKSGNPYINPFHVKVPQNIKTSEPRDWGSLYKVLMTDGLTDGFNDSLHNDLKSKYEELEPSNAVEALVIEAIDTLVVQAEPEGGDATEEPVALTASDGIPSYVPDIGQAFQEDLKAWLTLLDDEPAALWLQALKDLVCFHYMMYFMQLCKNLAVEHEHARNGNLTDFERRCRPIYFGMWDESAGSNRKFANEWKDNLDRIVYDSWGRLVVMRVLTEATEAEEIEIDPQPMTLTEAVLETDASFQEYCRQELLDVYPDADRPDDDAVDTLVDAALRLSDDIRRFHASKPSKENQSAFTLGYKVVRQLGVGRTRKYFRVQANRAGTNFRLNQSALRLFARLFEENSQTTHLNQFIQYLEKRGITLQDHAVQTMTNQLDEMSLIQKMSDSKEAIYVESI